MLSPLPVPPLTRPLPPPQLINTSPCPKTPANLPAGCTALRCEVRTTSGADVTAILGGQPSVLADRTLVEHALRMTLVADSLSLQFRLPPPGISAPQARSSAAIAGGCMVVDALVLTSVWAVQVLRVLSLVSAGRGRALYGELTDSISTAFWRPRPVCRYLISM